MKLLISHEISTLIQGIFKFPNLKLLRDYYSNWTEMTCLIWALLHAYLSMKEKSSKIISLYATVFSSLAFSNGIVKAFYCSLNSRFYVFCFLPFCSLPMYNEKPCLVLMISYWGLMSTDRIVCNILSLHQHLVLALVTFVDLCITNISFR